MYCIECCYKKLLENTRLNEALKERIEQRLSLRVRLVVRNQQDAWLESRQDVAIWMVCEAYVYLNKTFEKTREFLKFLNQLNGTRSAVKLRFFFDSSKNCVDPVVWQLKPKLSDKENEPLEITKIFHRPSSAWNSNWNMYADRIKSSLSTWAYAWASAIYNSWNTYCRGLKDRAGRVSKNFSVWTFLVSYLLLSTGSSGNGSVPSRWIYLFFKEKNILVIILSHEDHHSECNF